MHLVNTCREGLQSGIYFLRLQTEESVTTRNIIIQ
ncbi:T9SS type A sorting domain-containing protein [Sunxiuqinia sp. A32]